MSDAAEKLALLLKPGEVVIEVAIVLKQVEHLSSTGQLLITLGLVGTFTKGFISTEPNLNSLLGDREAIAGCGNLFGAIVLG